MFAGEFVDCGSITSGHQSEAGFTSMPPLSPPKPTGLQLLLVCRSLAQPKFFECMTMFYSSFSSFPEPDAAPCIFVSERTFCGMRRDARLWGNVNTLGLIRAGWTGNACRGCGGLGSAHGIQERRLLGTPAKEGVSKEREITDTVRCLAFKNGHEIWK